MISAEVFQRGGIVYSARPQYAIAGGGVVEFWIASAHPDGGLGQFRVDVAEGASEEARRDAIVAEYERRTRMGADG